MTITLANLSSRGNANDVALVNAEGQSLTYSALSEEVERLSGIIACSKLELKHGDAVSIALPNSMEFMTVFLAVLRAGFAAAPLNPKYTEDEFRFFLSDSESKVVMAPMGAHSSKDAATAVGRKVVEVAPFSDDKTTLYLNGSELVNGTDPVPPKYDDVALLLHTSGTTSRPKGVPLRHANIVASLKNISESYSLSSEDTALTVMPLFHVHGLIGVVLSTLFSGGTAVIPYQFSASKFWELQQKTKSTWYSAVPTIHQILLARADAEGPTSKAFRFIRSCSAALAPATLRRLESQFGSPVLEAYGMTEAAHQMSTNPLPPAERLSGTVGKGTGVSIAIRAMDGSGKLLPVESVGEVVIKGDNVMWGYRNNPNATREAMADGWFRTGDQGFLSSNDYLALTGRIKELINRGGEKISPLEVDAALLEHQAVAEAVTFGAPDDHYGERVHAAVVLKSDAQEDELRRFCRDRLADFKVPDVIHTAGTLPKTATGKIQRRFVAKHFLEQG